MTFDLAKLQDELIRDFGNRSEAARISEPMECVNTPPALTTQPVQEAAMAADSLCLSAEIWKPVLGFVDYEVSSLGRVRSVRVRRGSRAKVNGGILNGSVARINGNYSRVHVTLRRNGKSFHRKLHILVLEAFVGPRPDGTEGCHNDGNPLNNCLSNLRWDTHSANVADCIRHGTKSAPPIRRGECHHKTILTAADVRAIRSAPSAHGVRTRLGREFGVSLTTINRILKREVWAHVV